MNHLVYDVKAGKRRIRALRCTQIFFVRQTKGAYTSHLLTKRLKAAKAAGNDIFTMQSDLPS